MIDWIILADENVARHTIQRLRQLGYQVYSVAEESPGAADSEVLASAHELNAVLITFDRDFGAKIFNEDALRPRSVVYLRSIPSSPDGVIDVITAILDESMAGPIENELVVWTRTGTRKRSFPKKMDSN